MEFPFDEALIEATLGWCRRRVAPDAAEELAQDILCEALAAIRRGAKIRAFYPWFWRLAENRLRIFLRLKYHGAASLDEWQELPADGDVSDALIRAEEISALNYAVSRLSALHREILICRYLRELPVGEIAARLGVPEGTVKRRLHDAREDLRRSVESMENTGRSAWAPADLQLCGGYGAPDHWNHINELMTKQMLIACAFAARTVREIADEIGVAPVYFEEKLSYLLANGFMKETSKGRYLTDFVILPAQVEADFYSELSPLYESMAPRLTEAIRSVEGSLRAQDFYGNDMPFGYLLWLYYVWAADMLSVEMLAGFRASHPEVPDTNGKTWRYMGTLTRPDEEIIRRRPGKTVPWSNLHQNFCTPEHPWVCFANLFDVQPFANRDAMIGEYNIALVMKLWKSPAATLTEVEQSQAADLIANGFAEKRGGGIYLTLPVMHRNVKKACEEILREAVRPLASEWAGEIGACGDRMLLGHIRADLREEYVNWVMRQAFYPIGYIMRWGMDTGMLAIPADYSSSAAGCAIYYR